MNTQSTGIELIQQLPSYYREGGVFLDTSISSFSMDEEYTNEEYRDSFRSLSIPEIFGKDIFSDSKKVNLEKLEQRYGDLKGYLEKDRKEWKTQALIILEGVYAEIVTSQNYELRERIYRKLDLKGKNTLEEMYRNVGSDQAGIVDLYDVTFSSSIIGGNGETFETKFGRTLGEVEETLQELLHYFSIGSIHDFSDFHEIRNLIQELLNDIHSGKMFHANILYSLEKIHSLILMKNFYIHPNTEGIEDGTIVERMGVFDKGNLNPNLSIGNRISFVLEDSQGVMIGNGFDCEEATEVIVNGIKSKTKSVIRIGGVSRNCKLRVLNILDGDISIVGIPEVSIENASGNVTNTRCDTVNISDTQGVLESTSAGTLNITRHEGPIRNSKVKTLIIDGENQGWWKKRKYNF